jgi:hypothetical protein
MRNVSDQTCRENQNTHFVFNLKKSCRLCYCGKKNCTAGHVTDDVLRRMGWITKATDTHSEYVMYCTYLLLFHAKIITPTCLSGTLYVHHLLFYVLRSRTPKYQTTIFFCGSRDVCLTDTKVSQRLLWPFSAQKMWATRVAVNKLNKQPRTADEGWSSSLGVGRGANNPFP